MPAEVGGVMRVIMKRSGGFAGISREYVVDSAALTAAQEKSLRRAVAAAEKIDDVPMSDRADTFVFRLTIIDADVTREIRFAESDQVPELRVLVARIEKYSTGGTT